MALASTMLGAAAVLAATGLGLGKSGMMSRKAGSVNKRNGHTCFNLVVKKS